MPVYQLHIYEQQEEREVLEQKICELEQQVAKLKRENETLRKESEAMRKALNKRDLNLIKNF